MKFWTYLPVLLGMSLAVASPTLAQMQAMPVYFSPKGGSGITLDGDFGRISSSKVGVTSAINHPTAFGGRLYLGLPIVTLGVGASVYDTGILNQSSATQYMGSAAFKLLGGPLVPLAVSFQAGAGYLKLGSGTGALKSVTVPVGLGVALNIPTPGLSLEPWAGARLQLNSISSGNGTSSVSETSVGYGLSGGLNVGLPIGLGLHVAADWSAFGANAGSLIPIATQKLETLTVGIGVHYMIKLPGVGGVPIVPGG